MTGAAGAGGPLGIVALGGSLPAAIATAVAGRGRAVHLVGVEGVASRDIAAFPHGWVRGYEVGRLLAQLRAAGCRELVLAGAMHRPRLRDMRFDLGTLRMLALVFAAQVSGDDSVLVRITRAFEREGFVVRGVAEVAPELVGPPGVLTRARPRDWDEVAFGLDVLADLGRHDVGQAAVVRGRRVIAVEAAEGTTAMIERVAELRGNGRFAASGRAGVLVKGPKPQQELRNDMPALGPDTVRAAAAASLEGVAFVAGGVLLVDAAAMVRLADEAGLWLAGVEPPGAPA
jgi:DUF1009 family protein